MRAGAEVLVVGAGPSGLFAALELARHGVRARLVERAPEPHRAGARDRDPARHAGDPGAGRGGRDRFLDASVQLQFARVFDAELAAAQRDAPSRAPAATGSSSAACRSGGPSEILAERLAELGGTVERGVDASSRCEPTDDGVLAELSHADGTRGDARGRLGDRRRRRAQRHPGVAGRANWPGETYPGHGAGRRRGGVLRAAARRLGPDRHARRATCCSRRCRAIAGSRFVGDLDDGRGGAAGARRGRPAVAASGPAPSSGGSGGRCGWTTSAGRPRSGCTGGWRRTGRPSGGSCSATPGICRARSAARGSTPACTTPTTWPGSSPSSCAAAPGPAAGASYGPERGAAAQHVIETADQLHAAGRTARSRRPAPASRPRRCRPTRPALCQGQGHARHQLRGQPADRRVRRPRRSQLRTCPAPGDRYPDRVTLPGRRHHLLLYGAAATAGARRAGPALARTWST